MTIEQIAAGDPRAAPYRAVAEAGRLRAEGLFVAETAKRPEHRGQEPLMACAKLLQKQPRGFEARLSAEDGRCLDSNVQRCGPVGQHAAELHDLAGPIGLREQRHRTRARQADPPSHDRVQERSQADRFRVEGGLAGQSGDARAAPDLAHRQVRGHDRGAA